MTVKKLIEILKKADPDAQARIADGFYGMKTVNKALVMQDKIAGAKAKSADRTQVSLYAT